MKRVVLIMQALLSVLIVNAQDFRDTNAYLAKTSVIDSLLLDTKLKDRDRCEYLKESIAYKDTIIFVLRDSIVEPNTVVSEQRIKSLIFNSFLFFSSSSS